MKPTNKLPRLADGTTGKPTVARAATGYVAELQPGVWLADWDGDPGRTLRIENASRFESEAEADEAIRKAMRYRPFGNARAVAVQAT